MRTEEHAAEQAIAQFEEEKKRLYRKDGTKRYSDAEHDEILAELTAQLRVKVGGLIERAEKDAARHEQEVMKASYSDPTKGLISTESSRLSALRPLVAEDCERLPHRELLERLRAVSTGGDDVAKILHARYGAFRVRALQERLDTAAQEGRTLPDAAEHVARLRQLQETVKELEEQLTDPAIAKRREQASKAARESRELAGGLRRRLMEVDGTDAAAREATHERISARL